MSPPDSLGNELLEMVHSIQRVGLTAHQGAQQHVANEIVGLIHTHLTHGMDAQQILDKVMQHCREVSHG